MNKVVVFLLVLLAVSCSAPKPESDRVIIIEESDEDRPMFTVVLPDGKILEHFYAEEIAQGLLDGKWTNDEDLRLARSYEYRITLEDDSVHVSNNTDSVIAVLPYKHIGKLDSVFIKDNE